MDVKHVKCYLPYLLGHWIFMSLDTGVSLQPAMQRTSSSLNSPQTSLIPPHAAPSILVSSQRPSFMSHLRLFSNKVVILPEADNCFLFQLARKGHRAASRSGTSHWRHPVKKKRREESDYNPVFCSHAHLVPLTPPGTRSDLCRDLTPSSLSLMRFLSAPWKPHQIPCALQQHSGGPIAAWPRLDCRDCLAALPSCGVGLDTLSMAVEMQWLSH